MSQCWDRSGTTSAPAAARRTSRHGKDVGAALGRRACGSAAGPPFDMVLAADVVYGQDRDDRVATFEALLASLMQLTNEHSIVVLAYMPAPNRAGSFCAVEHFEGRLERMHAAR